MHRPGRRRFIRNFTLGAAAAGGALTLSSFQSLASPSTADATTRGEEKSSFLHGVASGDPLSDRVILWTRVTPERPGPQTVVWQIAADADFRHIHRTGFFVTGPRQDYTVKVDATGLTADTTYFYRFRVGEQFSRTGRTRTLPVGPTEQVKLLVFSCSNYPAGYFHAYREAARLEGIHAAVHLGDYLYEYQRGGYASEDAAALGREVEPGHEMTTLADYRLRHAQYRTDPDLQTLHAAVPFICVWDDHEMCNDVWREGADNHDADTEGDFFVRRAAAVQAYHEWIPIRAPDSTDRQKITRSFDFGDLVSLHMLDTRQIARDRQLNFWDYLSTEGELDEARFSRDLNDPTRQLIGEAQTAWLEQAMTRSGARWQVLGQQVLMARMKVPAPVALDQLGISEYLALRDEATLIPAALSGRDRDRLAGTHLPYNLDAWDGYPAARESVLAMARDLDKNLVVLAGDTHNAWASNLTDENGIAVGVEFATASVSSPGLEHYRPSEQPAALATGLVRLIEALEFAETGHRGFMVVTATPDHCQATWHFVSTVKSPSYKKITGPTLRVLPGAGNRVLRPAEHALPVAVSHPTARTQGSALHLNARRASVPFGNRPGSAKAG
ncbi:alkaline phosphatase D family protein [Aromatoleum evansii]|uniref:alkaline phosphatase D family protein n=1 Tax=Aromatoleum evansii TaxID=59406 RepID=UPI00145D3842|nr:alkaline phosphatase D family protein [Aromatoleum evansii]NMG31027.1 alkaline phosphatase [Aromatoleum evansii]